MTELEHYEDKLKTLDSIYDSISTLLESADNIYEVTGNELFCSSASTLALACNVVYNEQKICQEAINALKANKNAQSWKQRRLTND